MNPRSSIAYRAVGPGQPRIFSYLWLWLWGHVYSWAILDLGTKVLVSLRCAFAWLGTFEQQTFFFFWKFDAWSLKLEARIHTSAQTTEKGLSRANCWLAMCAWIWLCKVMTSLGTVYTCFCIARTLCDCLQFIHSFVFQLLYSNI